MGPSTRKITVLLLAATLMSTQKLTAKKSPVSESDPLTKSSTKDILDNYTFVADFSMKEPERPVSDEIFWRYPLKPEKVEFPLEPSLAGEEIPLTKGEGNPYKHLNQGRVFFLEGNFEEARKTWLGGRARFGKDYPHHRRNDYFIAYSFLNIAVKDKGESGLPWTDFKLTNRLQNAATFLSWAFNLKKDDPDPVVEAATPKGLYNWAAVLHTANRFAGSFGAAQMGLDFLRRTGRKEYRPYFHRFIAESLIRNQSYLEAIQSLDTGIRQDRDPAQSAAMFARVGDIYFDLNNYELAEDAYGLAVRINQELDHIDPMQLVLRAESLFWLGRFSDAQQMLSFAISGIAGGRVRSNLSKENLAWANLRLADAYLARGKIEDAKLAYFRVVHEARGLMPERIARVRSACLELPFYNGNNVAHGRKQLEASKVDVELPSPAHELAWACHTASFTERERTREMVERVRTFADRYPESRFLKSMAEPVRDVQAGRINDYFEKGDLYGAVLFFEKMRDVLYKEVPADLRRRLFNAYADIFRPDRAAEFWQAHSQGPDSDLAALRSVVVAAEMRDRTKGKDKNWNKRNLETADKLAKRAWRIKPDDQVKGYLARVMAVSTSNNHLPWIERLGETWATTDPSYVCDLIVPLWARRAQTSGKELARVRGRIIKTIDTQMPQLLQSDASCGFTLLELETKLLKTETGRLSQRYLARQTWPMDERLASYFWTVAEATKDAGNAATARELWRIIKEKGPRDAPEVRFATARLDPTRTVYEGLWEN